VAARARQFNRSIKNFYSSTCGKRAGCTKREPFVIVGVGFM